MLVPHIALTLSQSQDHATLSAVHKLIETFVKQANNKNGKSLSVSYISGNKLVASQCAQKHKVTHCQNVMKFAWK